MTATFSPVRPTIAFGDFNGNGLNEIVIIDTGLLRAIDPNSSYVVNTLTPSAVPPNPLVLTAADFNGDGFDDIAVTAFGSQFSSSYTSASIHLSQSGVSFGPPVHFPVGDFPISPTAADIDGDGDFDLLTLSLTGDEISVLENTTVATPTVPVMNVVGGTGQTVPTNTIFPVPFAVQVTSPVGTPEEGALVQFWCGPGSCLTANPVETDSNGVASAVVRSSFSQGTMNVHATTHGAVPVSAPFVTMGQGMGGSSLELELLAGGAQVAPIGSPFAAPLVVRVRFPAGSPGAGIPVANAMVTFTVNNSIVSLANGSIQSTDVNGLATAVLNAGTIPGSPDITVTTPSAVPLLTTFTTVASANLTLIAGNYQTVSQSETFPDPLVVMVTDVNGQHLSGAPVTFSAPPGAIVVTQNPVLSDEFGLAEAQVDAGMSQSRDDH